MPRVREIAPAAMSAEQAAIAERLTKTIGAVHGPYAAWIKKPNIADAMYGVMQCIRAEATMPRRMRMVATLVVIRHWGADYAWGVNMPLAQDAGVPQPVIDAIDERRRPTFTDEGDALGYDVATELLVNKRLSDTTFDKAIAMLGEEKLVELVTVIGYFSANALTVVAFDIKAGHK
jgi:4-carboxymuconolactone decarboxylase